EGGADIPATFADLATLASARERDPDTAVGYARTLESFERQYGRLDSFGSFEAGAVGLTAGRDARLFIATHWDRPRNKELSNILHECEEAAIIASAALRGGSRFVALQLLFHVSSMALSHGDRGAQSK